jgi:ribosomal protein L37AE/L43A
MPPVDRLQPIRAKSSESTFSVMEFMREFPDDEACLTYLWRTRYSKDGKTADCPKCGRERIFKRYQMTPRRQSWCCTGCGHHIYPTAGTIFAKSSTSLHLWFYAMYLITSTRCGLREASGARAWSSLQDRVADVQQDQELPHGSGRHAAGR